jgi:hypothetical protein
VPEQPHGQVVAAPSWQMPPRIFHYRNRIDVSLLLLLPLPLLILECVS